MQAPTWAHGVRPLRNSLTVRRRTAWPGRRRTGSRSRRSTRRPTCRAALRGYAARLRPVRARPAADHVRRQRPWTIRQYAGFSTAEESNAFYRRDARRRRAGRVGRLRPRHSPRLRLGPSARRRRRRQGRRGHRLGRGHEDPVRGHSARPRLGVDDHERRRAAGARRLHRRRRGAGGRAGAAFGNDPERHPERVHGAQHLHLSARAVDAHRRRHHRVHGGAHAEVQLDLDLRLSHAGSRARTRRSSSRFTLADGKRIRATCARAAAWTSTSSPAGCRSSSASA